MKKIIFSLAACCFAFFATAQDTIVLTDASRIVAKVTSITPDNISYLRFDNQSGPSYTVLRSKVNAIIYANGVKEVYNDLAQFPAPVAAPTPAPAPAATPVVSNSSTTPAQATSTPSGDNRTFFGRLFDDQPVASRRPSGSHPRIHFEAHLALSARISFGAQWNDGYVNNGAFNYEYAGDKGKGFASGGPGVNVDLGVNINEMFFVGLGLQYAANFFGPSVTPSNIASANDKVLSTSFISQSMPIYAVGKVYVGRDRVRAAFDAALGFYPSPWVHASIDTRAIMDGNRNVFDNRPLGGLYLRLTAGVEVERYFFGLGYELSTATSSSNIIADNFLFLKAGIRLF